MLVTFLVIMLLRLSQLSWTPSLGFCIFTPSECPGVIEIVIWFHFYSIIWKETRGQSGSLLEVWLCPKAEILLCCYVRLLVAFFWMWDWMMTGPQLQPVACQGPVKLNRQRRLLSYIHPAADHRLVRPSLLYWCLHLDPTPFLSRIQRPIVLSLAVCI